MDPQILDVGLKLFVWQLFVHVPIPFLIHKVHLGGGSAYFNTSPADWSRLWWAVFPARNLALATLEANHGLDNGLWRQPQCHRAVQKKRRVHVVAPFVDRRQTWEVQSRALVCFRGLWLPNPNQTYPNYKLEKLKAYFPYVVLYLFIQNFGRFLGLACLSIQSWVVTWLDQIEGLYSYCQVVRGVAVTFGHAWVELRNHPKSKRKQACSAAANGLAGDAIPYRKCASESAANKCASKEDPWRYTAISPDGFELVKRITGSDGKKSNQLRFYQNP